MGSGASPSTRRGWSVRTRLLVGLLLVTALGMSAAGAATFLLERQRVLTSIDSSLLSRIGEAHQIVLGASNSRSPSAPAAVPEPFVSARAALEAVVSRVLPATGESTVGILNGRATFVPGISTDFRIDTMPGLVSRATTETLHGQVSVGTVQSGSTSYRYIAAPITVAGSAQRAVFVVAVDVNRQLADLSEAFNTYWEVAAAAFVLVAGLGWFVSGRLLSPIRDLRMAAARITSQERTARILVARSDDLGQLASTVNDMLDRLDAAMTGQRQLLDDVRHELNTPLTIVRGHLELLDATNVAEVTATRALAIEELDRVGALVQSLALLAKNEIADPDRIVVEIGDFTAEVFSKLHVLPGHTWTLVESAAGSASFDRATITQAWLQLADNAAKYSPPGSVIEVGSSGTEESVTFWIANTGPEIPLDARERIFERFGRVDEGRGIKGSGLGLPIVRAIATAHGGRVLLASSPTRTQFGIEIPRLATQARPETTGVTL
jgi:two-component system, OmpR family, sensor kinase